MADLNARTKYILLLALLIPPGAAVWLLVRPEVANASTYAIFAALVLGAAAVVIHTWKSGQVTVSTSQLIHDTEVAVAARMQPPRH